MLRKVDMSMLRKEVSLMAVGTFQDQHVNKEEFADIEKGNENVMKR